MPVTKVIYEGLAATDMQKSVEKEFHMALKDPVMYETKYKKNVVEAYVYERRNKVTTILLLFSALSYINYL